VFYLCITAEHYYDATDKKEPMRIQEFKERFKEEILKRDLPQILNFSNSVIEFQVCFIHARVNIYIYS